MVICCQDLGLENFLSIFGRRSNMVGSYSAKNSYRLRISGYPKIDTIPKIDDFGWSRKNTQKIQKHIQNRGFGKDPEKSKNIQPETASGVKECKKEIGRNLCSAYL